MDENNKGTVVAEKSNANVSRYFAFTFMAFAPAIFFIITAATRPIEIVPDDIIILAVLLFFAIGLLVAGTFPLVSAINSLARPNVVIRDFGDYITIYFAFGKDLTLKYAEIDIFSGEQDFVRKPPHNDWVTCLCGNLYVKVNNKTRKIGYIKDVVSVRIELNGKVHYKHPKI